jgi:hypothetical protein
VSNEEALVTELDMEKVCKDKKWCLIGNDAKHGGFTCRETLKGKKRLFLLKAKWMDCWSEMAKEVFVRQVLDVSISMIEGRKTEVLMLAMINITYL